MRSILLSFVIVSGAFVAGCGSKDKPANTAGDANTVVDVAVSPGSPAPAASASNTTGVFLDTSIASACGIKTPKAYFEFDSANVKSGGEDTLGAVAACLSSGPLKGRNVRVIGHADPRGAADYNKSLGKSRADAVTEYLSTKGVERAKIEPVSQGEAKAQGADESGWAYDRRVDIRLAQ